MRPDAMTLARLADAVVDASVRPALRAEIVELRARQAVHDE